MSFGKSVSICLLKAKKATLMKQIEDLIKQNTELFKNEKRDKVEVNSLKKNLKDTRAKEVEVEVELDILCGKLDGFKGKIEELEA